MSYPGNSFHNYIAASVIITLMSLTRRGYLQSAALAAASLQAAEGEPQRIGVIGAGARSRAHFAGLARMPEAKVTAICDIDGARAREVNQTLGNSAAVYTDYRELIRDKNVAVVVVVAPNYLHHEMALAALRAGKDLVLEKPMGINYPQAVEILREARRSGRTVAMSMQRRYFPADIQAVNAVESGIIGTLREIQIVEMRGDWNPRGWQYMDPQTGKATNWRMLKRTAGSTELEFSLHSLGHVAMLVKSPMARVSASGGTVYYKDRDTRDLSNVLVEYESGARLNYSFSCFAPPAGSSFQILGDKGLLKREKSELIYYPQNGAPQVLPPAAAPENAEVALYQEFFADRKARRPSKVGPEFALEPMKVAFAAELSIAQNRVVTARDFSPV
jgi:predicted dehydrogenase